RRWIDCDQALLQTDGPSDLDWCSRHDARRCSLAFGSQVAGRSAKAGCEIGTTASGMNSMRPFLLLMVLLACVSNAALAVQPDEILKDPALEARARNLSRELRCMVCQNQSIDDSEAPLARDIRILVRERLTKGDSDQQVTDYLVARYGEFVLLRPRFEWSTALLWGLPPVALFIGAFALIIMARRQKAAPAETATLSAAEQNRLATLVDRGR